MKKAVTFILIIAVLCGGFYYCMQTGLIDRWFPGLLEEVIPGYTPASRSTDGRVSSDAANAVYVDSVSLLLNLGSGSGLIPRFAGSVEPQETREYKLEGDRTVKECFVKEGDEVRSGQKLFTYDTGEDESKLEQAQIDLERLQNTLDTSEAKKAELEKQKAEANTPAKELEVLTAENEIKQNELDQKSKQKEIDQLKDQIENSTVFCDMDGIVKSVASTNSDSDASGDSAYITVLKIGTYRIKAAANEQNIDQIFQGESVLVFSRVDSSVIWRGSITEIKKDQGSSGDDSDSDYFGSDNSAGSTNYPFYVDLEDSEGLMLGQHVYLEQDLGQENAKTGVWINDYYIAQDEDGTSFVWAASDDNKLEKRVVELGRADEELSQHEILSGLSASDYICEPQSDLEEGLPVTYNDPSGEGETESMFLWDYDENEDFDWMEDDFDEDEDDEWMEDEYDEDETDMDDFFAYLDEEDYEDDEEYMTDEEGYIILD